MDTDSAEHHDCARLEAEMWSSRAILPAILWIALRRALPLWIALRILMFVALLMSAPRADMASPATASIWPDGYWSFPTMDWLMLLGSALLFVQERTLWRESVLIGNLGLPRFAIIGFSAGMIMSLDLLLRVAVG